jgi:colicin import membrane protein
VVEPAPDAGAEAAAAEAEREAEAQRVAEAAHVAEERRVAEERLATERKAQEEATRRKTEQVAREKAEREKKEKERLEREKVEREKAEQERRQRELAQAERARTQREAELNAQIAAEERLAAARASGQLAQYLSQITARIERAWKRPPGAAAGLQCEVRVTQVPGGVVTGVQVGRCNGDDTVRQSIEDAVYRASPLPQPADPALFDRNLTITFRPEN